MHTDDMGSQLPPASGSGLPTRQRGSTASAGSMIPTPSAVSQYHRKSPPGKGSLSPHDPAHADLRPASPQQIATCLDKLGRVFGYPPDFQNPNTAGIWIDALADLPIDLLIEATDRYIMEPTHERKRFPQPGQLRAIVSEEMAARHVDRLRREQRAQKPQDAPVQRITPEEAEEIWAKYGGRPARPKLPASTIKWTYVVDEVPETIAGVAWRDGAATWSSLPPTWSTRHRS